MTNRLDVACGHLLAARWQTLAEQRLEHLTELFESGRWRRYYSERAFLENIQEAKAAVGTWRNLSRAPAEIDDATMVVDLLALEQALNEAAPAFDTTAIEQRYPVLRNVL